jgi:aminopeptidase YwaD
MVPVRGGREALPYVLGALAACSPALAQERSIPFWPDAVPAAIHAEIDGVATLETVRELSRFHRVQGSPGFAAAAEHMRRKAAAAGLSDAAIERFPADGKTKYGHFRSYYGWAPVSATLEEVSPTRHRITAFPDLPVALADYSQSAEVTAPLVDVGAGTKPADYEGRDVRGKLVLADGDLPTVHRLACLERGAAGFLSAFPNQKTPWSGDDRDLVRWGHLSPYELQNRFAFMVSKRQAEDFRARLAAGETIVLSARVDAKMIPATYDVVVATIPGTDPASGEVILTAHLCHQSAGANDNASGSAAILEVGRALAAAIRRDTLPPPKRTIRFLWVPEIAGSQAYLVRHPELVSRIVAGVHMDMVGGLLSTTKGTFHLSRTAESLPHVVNPIAEAWFAQVQSASMRYAEGRGGDAYAGFVWPPGSREPFVADVRGIEMGSDHEVFEAAGFRIPMLYFHDYPDVTIHTQKDLPENLDETKLGRVAYIGAGIVWTLAALPDSEAKNLLAATRAEVEQRVLARGAALGPDPALAAREAIVQGVETLESLARLCPSMAPDVARDVEHLRAAMPPAPPTSDRRTPVRAPGILGPLNVYYYDYFADLPSAGAGSLGRLGSQADLMTKSALAAREDGEVLAYEAFNLADGKRSVSEIRDVLSGRYSAVPVSAVAEYFELLAKAGAVSFR